LIQAIKSKEKKGQRLTQGEKNWKSIFFSGIETLKPSFLEDTLDLTKQERSRRISKKKKEDRG